MKRKVKILAHRFVFFRACIIFFAIISCFNPQQISAQNKLVKGRVIYQSTHEPMALASVYWKQGYRGCVTDSSGFFSLPYSNLLQDSLMFSFVGCNEIAIPAATIKKNNTDLVVMLETATANEVKVVSKFNKGLRWWRNIVAHKTKNSPRNINNYYCDLYNKLEIDITNISKENIAQKKTLKQFAFLLDNMDSLPEEKPFLPVFLTESLSAYFVSQKNHSSREEISALQTSGIKNESVMEYLGGINQKINAYDDFITVFGKEFISPISTNGNKFYNYKGADTLLINGEKYFHLLFTPKHEEENLFKGDCWIHSKSWALKKINLCINNPVNINFTERISITQEYEKTNDSLWMPAKDKFTAEVAPFGKSQIKIIGRKTTVYKSIQTNQSFVNDVLAKNKKPEEVIVNDDAPAKGNNYWNTKRLEPLSQSEQHAASLIDTLKQMPSFRKLSDEVTFIVDGHKKFGAVEIGPWYKWMSYNNLEGTRFRFDLGTTTSFNKNLRLFGYAAYGINDGLWKGKLAATYKLFRNNGWIFNTSYTHDIDNCKTSFDNDDDITTDNIFSGILRRKNIKQKFITKDEWKLFVTKNFANNFSVAGSIIKTGFETYDPFPAKKLISLNEAGTVNNTEFGIKLRYAPGEKNIESHRRLHHIKSNLPLTELSYAFAEPGVFGSEYRYQKLNLNVSQRFRIPRLGQVSYMAYAGKIWGDKIPFMLLEVHPGNEVFYYDRNSFNLMNRYEYFSDAYAGFNIEHNFEKKLLNLLPFMKKSRMRQFWNVKTVWGNLSGDNRQFNRFGYGAYQMRSLNNNTYTEIGTGFDNIAKFFRIDLVWRFSPKTITDSQKQDFGIFASFKLQF